MLGSLNIAAPVATNNCGTLLSFRYCRIAALGGVPRVLNMQGDLLLLDQPARLLHRLRRAVPVVEADEIDLAAVDAALLVDHPEIGGLGLADQAVGDAGPL